MRDVEGERLEASAEESGKAPGMAAAPGKILGFLGRRREDRDLKAAVFPFSRLEGYNFSLFSRNPSHIYIRVGLKRD